MHQVAPPTLKVVPEPLLDGVVPPASVRCDVRVGVDRGGSAGRGDAGHDFDGIALVYLKPASPRPQASVERMKVCHELAMPGLTCCGKEGRIKHVKRNDSVGVFTGCTPGRVIAQSEITAEPHHGPGRHTPSRCDPAVAWVCTHLELESILAG
jgi:hypothetical protein